MILAVVSLVLAAVAIALALTSRGADGGGDGRVTSRGEVVGVVALVSDEGVCVQPDSGKQVCGQILVGPGAQLPHVGDRVSARLVFVSNPDGSGYGPLLLVGAR